MEEKIKIQKGFIQIPLLVIIIVSIVVVSTGVSLYFHEQEKGLATISEPLLSTGNELLIERNERSEYSPCECPVDEPCEPKEIIKEVIVEVPVEVIKEVEKIIYEDKIVYQDCPSCDFCWQCGEWSDCMDSQQTRTCTYSNNCVITSNKPATAQSCIVPSSPNYLMPDKPIIESFCDNKGNCVHSHIPDPNSTDWYLSPLPTIHVGETLNFTIKVSGEETLGILALIVPQEYDWVKEGGEKSWGTDLTYSKTFTAEDISTSYTIYAYIKSQNDNYHRKSKGCFWIDYSCDDSLNLNYIVLP